MSLINRMLQDLDARRSETTGAGAYGEQIRAVPERHKTHPAWWLALVFALALVAVTTWALLRPLLVQAPSAHPLPLKLDLNIDASTMSGVTSNRTQTSYPLAEPTVSPAVVDLPQATSTSTIALRVEPPSPATSHETAAAFVSDQAPAKSPQRSALADNVGLAKPVAESLKAKPPVHITEAPQKVTQEDGVSTVTGKGERTVEATAPAFMPAKQIHELTSQQRAENEYRQALLLIQQGRTAEAVAALEQSLALEPRHAAARQALVGVYLEIRRVDDAARSAREGLSLDASQTGLAMILARLQTEKNELRAAIGTLEHSLPYGADRSDYQAFFAALLQRDQRHAEAIEHYLAALKIVPQNGVWWMGLGISLQADKRLSDAKEAFRRAKAGNGMTPELLSFVDGRLSQLP